MKRFIKKLWTTMRRPAVKISLGTLTLGGFIAGVIFWGGFNTALEVTNTEKFCISCHSMRDNVYEELQGTVHWSNPAGIRATCPDCHVPHGWTDKIARKMQASKEVFAELTGAIGTREKFLAKRLTLAQHEWARFDANKSKECKSCHSYDSMKWDEMSPTARVQMSQAAEKDQSCLDCHKGIAHHLPDKMNLAGGMVAKLAALSLSTRFKDGEALYSVRHLPMYDDEALTVKAGLLSPATKVTVVKDEKDAILIELKGWRKDKGFGRVLYQDFALNINSAALSKELAQNAELVKSGPKKMDDMTGLDWQDVSVQLWMKKTGFIDSLQPIWMEAKQSYQTNCSICHTQPAEAHFDANTWPGMLDGMLGFVNFDADTKSLVLKYLQLHSSDFVDVQH